MEKIFLVIKYINYKSVQTHDVCMYVVVVVVMDAKLPFFQIHTSPVLNIKKYAQKVLLNDIQNQPLFGPRF